MQQHTPFLQLVAQHVSNSAKAANIDLSDVCVIFPNRRSGTFFRRELVKANSSTFILPEITTIENFISDITGIKEIDRLDALFILYDSYRKISGVDQVPFEQFLMWGDMVINDFNDIDKSLCDPREILTNARQLKELKSNYLTKEQLATLQQYFNISQVPDTEGEHFWKHLKPDGELKNNDDERYPNLWAVLDKLYDAFNAQLKEEQISYSGHIYKEAVSVLKNLAPEELPFKRYVFVGFNVLSQAEVAIFSALKNKGVATFYWDFNSPAFNVQESKSRATIACKFMDKNIELFPAPSDFAQVPINDFPEIKVVGVPSNIGQAQYAREVVNNTNVCEGGNVDTAVVLPNESLLMPLVSALSSSAESKGIDLNITLGYPLRLSAICNLMKIIARLHAQSRKQKDEFLFFHEDVKEFATHPLMNKLLPKAQMTKLLNFVAKCHLFMIPSHYLTDAAPALSNLLQTPQLRDFQDFERFLSGIIVTLQSAFTSGDNAKDAESIEYTFVSMYARLLQRLSETVNKYKVTLEADTSFYLLDRIATNESVAFEGMPLSGLQIMGVLETRCLDFKNIILLSANEKVYPKKRFTRSFIPNSLRRIFGLPTTDDQESMHSYYFYRMLSRAQNVHLLYDSRTEGISSGEYSRFIYQLQYIFQAILPENFIALNAMPSVSPELGFSVPKDERTIKSLEQYCSLDENDKPIRSLSASSLRKYIECPLAFYLKYIEKVPEAEEVSDFMDSAVVGTITHDCLKEIYQDYTFTAQALRQIESNTAYIEQLVTKYTNIHFNNKTEDEAMEELSGEPKLVSAFIKAYIERVLGYDADLLQNGGTIEVLDVEVENVTQLPLAGSERKVNFKYVIDRLDKLCLPDKDPVIRIIDYKTGKDEVNFKSVDELFHTKNSGDWPHAIMQLFTYANCLINAKPEYANFNIQPMIYKLKSISSSGVFHGKDQLTDFRKDKLNQGFVEKFSNCINEILDPETAFASTSNPKSCTYCNFKEICKKEAAPTYN